MVSDDADLRASYSALAPFYDELMGDASARAASIRRAAERWRPGAHSILELGCGTGSVLAALEGWRRVGVDRSRAMIERARQRVPEVTIVTGDITAVALDERFDVVACVFDTLNHVTDLSRWGEVVAVAADHLVSGGLFVLDVNTTGRLAQLVEAPPWVHDFARGILIMDVRGGLDGVTHWHLRIFEREVDGRFTLHEEVIDEAALELESLVALLSSEFEVLESVDGEGETATDSCARAFVVARRR